MINALSQGIMEQVLTEKKIRTVYQPIISLDDGSIFGYESLSRIDIKNCSMNIEELFQLAEKLNCVWELEALCRKKSLKNAYNKPEHTRLFINVDPNVIHDEKFKNGTTAKYLRKYGLKPDEIVFEITERTSIQNPETFKKTIQHYKEQNYQIAVDDFGAEFSGINRICVLNPHFIKIDKMIVRGIDKDSFKQSLVESFVTFCRNTQIYLIAEGIETKEELQTLMRTGVSYGQGYYIQYPKESLELENKDIKEQIKAVKRQFASSYYQRSFFGDIGTICRRKETVSPDIPGTFLYEYIKKNTMITEICVIDSGEKVLGILTKDYILERFGGRYGYSLNEKKTAKDLADKEFMAVDSSVSIEAVSKMAMLRTTPKLYDAVVVTKNEKYMGVVTVKELLETAVNIQVTKAVDANPLTGLPGNSIIQEEVLRYLKEDTPFAVAYLDLDHFKAYNDAYGFNNGDLMIKALVECMKECCRNHEFLGHIGGDDFVIISRTGDLEQSCKEIIHKFSTYIKSLYTKNDWERGFICSKNREGADDVFPIATLSIAIATNHNHDYNCMEALSEELAVLKKKAKQEKGNSLYISK